MSWLYESFTVPSEINGAIRCTRAFGQWAVVVGGTGQSNSRLSAMWRRAFAHVPRTDVRRVLMLGFGTGGAVLELHRRFPGAHVTTIELDPVMVDLARRFGRLRSCWPEVHIGAAADVLATLHGTYDLIISDLFLGHAVAPETAEASVQNHIARLVHPQGHVLMNAYDQPEMIDVFRTHLIEVARWNDRENWIGHLRPHGAGVLGDALPPGYVPYVASADYLKREYADWKPFEAVQSGDAWGVRRRIGPVLLERYIGEAEPHGPSRGARIIIWHPVTRRTSVPKGWRRMFGGEWRRLTGYVDLSNGVRYDEWSERARRERKKWLAQDICEIREVGVDDYCRAYARSKKSSTLIQLFSDTIRRRVTSHGDRQKIWGAVVRATGEIVAGFVTLDIPEINTSLHATGFILDAARPFAAGTGLVDHWLTRTHAQGLRYADFDGFYAPGDPGEWKGFSEFKAQFGTKFIAYPDPFWRFVR